MALTLEITMNRVVGSKGYYDANITDLGYQLWNSTDFPGASQEYVDRGLNSALYCPVNKRYKISGNYLSKSYCCINLVLIIF